MARRKIEFLTVKELKDIIRRYKHANCTVTQQGHKYQLVQKVKWIQHHRFREFRQERHARRARKRARKLNR